MEDGNQNNVGKGSKAEGERVKGQNMGHWGGLSNRDANELCHCFINRSDEEMWSV